MIVIGSGTTRVLHIFASIVALLEHNRIDVWDPRSEDFRFYF
jgi:hypothetical protein